MLTALLVLSAVCELFGTVTVAVSYQRGHRLAQKITNAVQERVGAEPPQRYKELRSDDPHEAYIMADQLRGALADTENRVGEHLKRQWWLTAGLVSYAAGALAALAAGLVALYH